MNKFFYLFIFLSFLPLFIQQNSIKFSFPRKLYVQKNIDNKLINITSSVTNDKVKLFSKNKKTNYENQCSSDSNNSTLFICSFLDYGTYNFYYEYQNNKYSLSNTIQIFSSLNEIFTITKSRETNCLFKNEPFQYILIPNKGINIDFSTIQVYAFSRVSSIKNITVNTTIKLKNDSNTYTIKDELSLSNFEIVVTENDDIRDSLGTYQKITVTNLVPDKYFFPSLNKIRFTKTYCDLKIDKLILNRSISIYCNETSKRISETNAYFCFYKGVNLKFGKTKIMFNNFDLGEIFSSNSINKTKFETSVSGFTFSISNPKKDFYMGAINPILFYNIWDTYGIYKYKSSKLILSNDILSAQVDSYSGFNASAVKIERKLYELETIFNVREFDYYFYEGQSVIYTVHLPPVYFEPDYVITGNTHEPIPHNERISKIKCIIRDGTDIFVIIVIIQIIMI